MRAGTQARRATQISLSLDSCVALRALQLIAPESGGSHHRQQNAALRAEIRPCPSAAKPGQTKTSTDVIPTPGDLGRDSLRWGSISVVGFGFDAQKHVELVVQDAAETRRLKLRSFSMKRKPRDIRRGQTLFPLYGPETSGYVPPARRFASISLLDPKKRKGLEDGVSHEGTKTQRGNTQAEAGCLLPSFVTVCPSRPRAFQSGREWWLVRKGR